MQIQNRVLRDRDRVAIVMNPRQSPPISLHLLFIPVAKMRRSEDHRVDSGSLDLHPFDPVGRDSAFYQRVVSECCELLWRLSGKQFLPAFELSEIGQVPANSGWYQREITNKTPQGHHSAELLLRL